MASALVPREFERSVIDEGNQIRESFKLLFQRASLLRLNQGVPNRPLRRLTAPFVGKESDVVGRDGDKKKIIELLLAADTSRCFIELLLSADTSRCFIELLRRSLSCCHGDKEETIGNNLSVIPIVGMGGIGKTTLAQLVYKDSRVEKHFDLKAWVTVSEEFDVLQLTKRIYKEATSQECQTDDVFVLQTKLNEVLRGQRFLFVLDDVWNENYGQWDYLKSGFQSGAGGSTMIVTTRSKDVALTMCKRVMHELELVSDEDCWRIFEKHAFDDSAEATAKLKEIGRKIVERCKGLPLAVKSVAGLLRTTSNAKEWEKILKSDVWLKNDIVPALWLSYHFLPPVLKRCFAYCSIFPKDYEFEESDLEKISLLWMAEGLLTPEDGERMEDVGNAYLQALISRSFFQQSSRKKSAMVMHDLVHDLAMLISGEFSFSCGDSNDLSNLGTKSCHLSYRKRSDDLMKLGAVSQSREKKLMSLRTLIALPLSPDYPPDMPISLHELFLKVGGCLRVLSLSCFRKITELPDSIGNMKYLRYLDLSSTSIKELPDSICTFYNLQTLLLSVCLDLVRLPTRLAALVNLHHLDISYTYSLKEMPPQMCKMKSLERLSDFVLGENGSWRIKELGELPLLGGRLRISGLQYIVDVKDVLEANLKDKKFLSELILEWQWEWIGMRSSQEERVLEALEPHTSLKQFRIWNYIGTIFPDWVGHESFCNIVEVELRHCRFVSILPPLGQLSSLRKLRIMGLDGVVSIGNEFCGSSSTTTNHPFTSLEELEISAMASWEEWSFSSDRLGQEGGVFPSLTELRLDFCRNLVVGLPDCHIPSLKSIEITFCREMMGLYRQEMDNNAFPSLQSISIRRCKKFWENRMKWGLERLPSLMKLSLFGIGMDGEVDEVDSFPEEGLLPTTLTHLSIECFEKLKGLNGRTFQHLTSLQNLTIDFCRGLECLPQEGLPLSLSCLRITSCPLLEQRCQRETGEDWPKIKHIPKILRLSQQGWSNI